MRYEKPWYVQLVAGLLFLLTAWWVWISLITVRCSGYSLTIVLRVLALTAAMCVTGWALWKGIAWGYLLGLALAGPWLVSTAWYFLTWSDRWAGRVLARSNVVPGCVILAGLLMPRAVRWFREAWRARSQRPAIG